MTTKMSLNVSPRYRTARQGLSLHWYIASTTKEQNMLEKYMTATTEINSELPLRHPTSASRTNDHSSAPGMVRMADLLATLE
jgi:hypothetical protein